MHGGAAGLEVMRVSVSIFVPPCGGVCSAGLVPRVGVALQGHAGVGGNWSSHVSTDVSTRMTVLGGGAGVHG